MIHRVFDAHVMYVNVQSGRASAMITKVRLVVGSHGSRVHHLISLSCRTDRPTAIACVRSLQYCSVHQRIRSGFVSVTSQNRLPMLSYHRDYVDVVVDWWQCHCTRGNVAGHASWDQTYNLVNQGIFVPIIPDAWVCG